MLHIIQSIMGSQERKEQLRLFMDRFDQAPVLLSDNNRPLGLMEEFLVTYLGKCFMEGYRLLEKLHGNIFVLSLLEFQVGGRPAFAANREPSNCTHGAFKIISVEFNEKLNEDRELRMQRYKRVREVAEFLCDGQVKFGACPGIEVHFLFAVNFQYSVVGWDALQRGLNLGLEKFYARDYGIGRREDKEGRRDQFCGGLKVLDEREQGTKLHEVVELLLKGAGVIRNQKHLVKQVLHHSKFLYKLDKVINSICLVIGREMIEGGYTTISSEKWMRKFSQKKFKKFDLLLRTPHKVCIIDWKFSKVNADQKIVTEVFAKKNLEYSQLARKEYNAGVELKFYCFHQSHSQHHHKFTRATYDYSIEEIEIKDREYFVNEDNQIEIESDSDDDPGERKWHRFNAARLQKQAHSHKGTHIFGRLGQRAPENGFSQVFFDKSNEVVEFSRPPMRAGNIVEVDNPSFVISIEDEQQKQKQREEQKAMENENVRHINSQMYILSSSEDEPMMHNELDQMINRARRPKATVLPPMQRVNTAMSPVGQFHFLHLNGGPPARQESRPRKNEIKERKRAKVIDLGEESEGEECIIID